MQPAHRHPGERAHPRSRVGHENGVHRQPVRSECRAAVEAEPAEPQDAGADDGQADVMRLKAIGLAFDPRTQHEGRDQGRHTGTDVDDRSTGKVHDAHLGQPATLSPDPVADRRVDEEAPQQGEQDESLEALALCKGTDDEGRRDDREHHLEQGEGRGRNRARIRTGLHADALETDVVEVPDDPPAVDVLPEGKGVAHQHPSHADQGQDEHALHEDAEHVLATHEPAVEQRQTRRHQHGERRGGQDPGGVSGIQDRGSFDSRSQRNVQKGFGLGKRMEALRWIQ